MIKAWMITALLVATTMEPVTSDPDLVRYAITQGGLLAVVLVVLWSYRRDTLSVLEEKDERIKVLMDLASVSTTAQTRTADAVDRMARAIENLELRR